MAGTLLEIENTVQRCLTKRALRLVPKKRRAAVPQNLFCLAPQESSIKRRHVSSLDESIPKTKCYVRLAGFWDPNPEASASHCKSGCSRIAAPWVL